MQTIESINRSKPPRTLMRMAVESRDCAAIASRLAALHYENNDRALADDAAAASERHSSMARAAADRAHILARDNRNYRNWRAWIDAAKSAKWTASNAEELSKRARYFADKTVTVKS